MTDNPVLIVLGVCFSLGYWAVSTLFKKQSGQKNRRYDEEHWSSGGANRDGDASMAEYYRKVLRVSDSAAEEELRTAYRSQLAKYHPDKVSYLGDDFYDLASRRTKEIIEAYEFLRQQHGLKSTSGRDGATDEPFVADPSS